MDRLQLFTIFTSVWLRAIGALLAASLIACTVAPDPGHVADDAKPHVDVGPAFFEHAPQHEAMTFQRQPDGRPGRGHPQVLRRHRYRSLTEDDGVVHLYADRNRWAPWSGLVAHISIVVILAGAMIGSMWGFRDSQFMVAEGSTSAIPTVAGATITVNSFKDTYNTTTGAPLDYVSDVTVTQDGEVVVANHQLRVNEPLRYRGVSFYQAFFGPAAVLTVTDAEGEVALRRGRAAGLDARRGRQQGRLAHAPRPGPDRLGRGDQRARTTRTIKPGQVAVELYTLQHRRGGHPAGRSTRARRRRSRGSPSRSSARPSSPASASRTTPGRRSSGSAASCCRRLRRSAVRPLSAGVWGRLEARPDGGASLAIAAVGRRDTGFDAEFTAIVTDIRQAVVGQAQS